jgi:hypothetical protein
MVRSSEPQPPNALDWVSRVERRVRAVSERAMRVAILREMLADLDADHVVSALGLLFDRAQGGHSDARRVLQELALQADLFMAVPYPVRSVAYTRALKAGRNNVAQMLLVGGKSGNPGVGEAHIANDYVSHSVGERCTQARSRDRFKLDRLLHDRDYRVIRLLLENSVIVERDVVKIAAMRPTRPEILEQIASHRKWASRYSVRKALSCNPHTPPSLARRLIPTLLKQDLLTVVETGGIPDDIRAQASQLMGVSKGG